MRTLYKIALTSLFATLPIAMVACGGDDDDSPGTGGSAGTAGSAGTGATAGTAGTGGNAGTGGATAHATIPSPTGNLTLTADKIWDLSDLTYVADGQTLTIEPGTRIEGKKSPLGVLIVQRGGKLVAEGTADAPIVFTSAAPVGSRAPGDWGGIILLGKAPKFVTEEASIEGLPEDVKHRFGGTDPADSSGSLKYVRIEFPGYKYSGDNEINGLTFGGVGSGTTIENVFVNSAADDCFEWFGGTVNVKHLVCQNSDDDMFDTDWGYQGTIDTAFGRLTIPPTEGSNGLETGYDDKGSLSPTMNTKATYKNITACGYGSAVTEVGYGAFIRDYVDTTIDNYVALGYKFGVDVERPHLPANLLLTNTTFFSMFGADQIANPSDDDNKDQHFDETAWFNTAGANNSTTALAFTVADCNDAAGPKDSVKNSGAGAFKQDAAWMNWIKAEWWAVQ